MAPEEFDKGVSARGAFLLPEAPRATWPGVAAYPNRIVAHEGAEIMRKLLTALGLLVAIGLAVGLSAQEGKPINAKCPVKGEPAKADVTTTFQGKVIGFC